MLLDELTPYAAQNSALDDCQKLTAKNPLCSDCVANHPAYYRRCNTYKNGPKVTEGYERAPKPESIRRQRPLRTKQTSQRQNNPSRAFNPAALVTSLPDRRSPSTELYYAETATLKPTVASRYVVLKLQLAAPASNPHSLSMPALAK